MMYYGSTQYSTSGGRHVGRITITNQIQGPAHSSVTQFTRIDSCEVSGCAHGARTSYLSCSQALSWCPRHNTLSSVHSCDSSRAHSARRAVSMSDPSAGRACAVARSQHAPRHRCRRSAWSRRATAAAAAAESTMRCCSAVVEFVTPCQPC